MSQNIKIPYIFLPETNGFTIPYYYLILSAIIREPYSPKLITNSAPSFIISFVKIFVSY
jgi:hypothetical protein